MEDKKKVPDPASAVIVLPSYNEGRRIKQVIDNIRKEGFTRIVVVDDGSTDHSIETIRESGVIILTHIVNRGAGAATETGLKYCREVLHAEIVVMIDADTQHDAGDISRLIAFHLEHKADITIGNRFMGSLKEIPFKNLVYNLIANIITSIFAGRKISDSQSGFKVFGRRAVNEVVLEQDRFEHCSEIFIKAQKIKLKIIDVPINVYYSEEIRGKGQHFLNGVRTFINLLYSVLFKTK